MGYTKKLHREPLPEDVVAALLASPILEGVPAGERLKSLRAELEKTVKAIRESLASNPLAGIVANAVAKRIGRRGNASIVVDENGAVVLEIRYQTNGEKRGWHSNLPSLEDLRKEAEGLGIDVSKMGRSKIQMAEAIQKASSSR